MDFLLFCLSSEYLANKPIISWVLMHQQSSRGSTFHQTCLQGLKLARFSLINIYYEYKMKTRFAFLNNNQFS